MPKKSSEKNNKDKNKKTTKSTVSKNNNAKKVEVKKNETKKEEIAEKVVKKERKRKGKIKECIVKYTQDTPFFIAVCIIILLIGILLLVLSTKRVPKTTKGEEIIENLKESYGTNSLVDLIDTYIADKEVSITKDDEDYVDEVVNYYKDYAEYYGVDLETFLKNYVGLTGITTEDEFRNYVLEDYKKTLAVKKFVGDNADEKDLKNYYKDNYSDKLTVKHILIEVDSEAEDTEKAEKEAYNKAADLIKTLEKTSKDKLEDKFDELAKENSDDAATYSKGGLIEDFSKSDVLSEFFEASNKLKDGEYTKEPVKTSYGYHIILKIGSKPVEKYDDIKEEVKLAYAEKLLSEDTTLQVSKWDELRKQYKLSIKDDAIKASYKATIKNATNKNDEDDKQTDEQETEDK